MTQTRSRPWTPQLPLLLGLVLVALVACIRAPAATPSTPTSNPTRPPTVTPAATLPPSPIPSPTATQRPTSNPTAAPTSTPTATPSHPLSITAMRQRTYPGSDISVEQTLSSGANYDRYVVSYRSDGLKVYALLTVPQGSRPPSGWPIIVFNHGYIPPDQYRTAERYVAYVDGFARNGYIVFRPDYRGHGDSEGEPTGAFTAPDYTVDVLNAVSSVKRHPDADPDRVGMWGHSMGGTLTLRAMIVTDDIQAGVIWAGVVASIEDIWERRREWVASHLPDTPTPQLDGTPPRPSDGLLAYGSFEENPAFWQSVDPVFHLQDLSGPIQLHHGTGDASVPVDFSEDLYERLEEADQSAELYLYEGDNHNLTKNFATAMQRSLTFFDEHVKGASTGASSADDS